MNVTCIASQCVDAIGLAQQLPEVHFWDLSLTSGNSGETAPKVIKIVLVAAATITMAAVVAG